MKITRCKLSKKVQVKLLEFFVAEVTARALADLLSIQYNTAILFYRKIRLVIECNFNLEAKDLFDGEVELDESYFVAWSWCRWKNSCFWSFKAQWWGLAVAVKDTKSDTLMPIITNKIKPDSIVYTDSYKGYNAIDVSDFKHFRINHSKEFAKNHNHINGIENFWNQAKRVLRKYNGIDKKNFHLFYQRM